MPGCIPQTRTGSHRRNPLAARIFLGGFFFAISLPARLYAEGPAIPRGVFSLAGVGEPADPSVLSDPDVDGISVRYPWRKLEPSKGVYDWTFVDSEMARAAKAGKMAILRILCEGPASPRWVFSEGVETFSYDNRNRFGQRKSGEIAVFWDPTYLKEKKAMIEAAGKHLSGNPALRVVAAICASSHSGDWAVPHTRPDVDHWFSVGYTSDKLIDVCRQIIDVTMQSYPNQCVTLAIGRNGRLDPDPDYVPRQAIRYARAHYPGRFIVQKNSLAANTEMPGSPKLKHFQLLWDSRPDVAGQMLWFSYGDPTCRNNGRRAPCDPEATLHRAIDIGLAYAMKYIEIYHQDVLHLPALIPSTHNALPK